MSFHGGRLKARFLACDEHKPFMESKTRAEAECFRP
jgi:hypothetical protein